MSPKFGSLLFSVFGFVMFPCVVWLVCFPHLVCTICFSLYTPLFLQIRLSLVLFLGRILVYVGFSLWSLPVGSGFPHKFEVSAGFSHFPTLWASLCLFWSKNCQDVPLGLSSDFPRTFLGLSSDFLGLSSDFPRTFLGLSSGFLCVSFNFSWPSSHFLHSWQILRFEGPFIWVLVFFLVRQSTAISFRELNLKRTGLQHRDQYQSQEIKQRRSQRLSKPDI